VEAGASVTVNSAACGPEIVTAPTFRTPSPRFRIYKVRVSAVASVVPRSVPSVIDGETSPFEMSM
jgi:hypothetical protein